MRRTLATGENRDFRRIEATECSLDWLRDAGRDMAVKREGRNLGVYYGTMSRFFSK